MNNSVGMFDSMEYKFGPMKLTVVQKMVNSTKYNVMKFIIN